MKPGVIGQPVEDQCVHIISSDEESLPHMLSHDCEEESGCDGEYDGWSSPMTNSVEDGRLFEISSTSSTSNRYPQSDVEHYMLNTLLNSVHRYHRSTSSCESIVTVTDEERERNGLRRGPLVDLPIGPRHPYLKPRFSRRSPSPTDSQHSNAYNSNESNGAYSWDSSPRRRNMTTPKIRRKNVTKDKQESPISASLRPPPSPTPSLLSSTQRQKLHRRSVSLNSPAIVRGSQSPDKSKLSTLTEGEQERHISQKSKSLPTSPLSSLARHRERRASYNAHRRSVSFPDQVAQSRIDSNPSMLHSLKTTPSKTIHNHDDPALFSLIGATMGGHDRVCITPDVDPNLTHMFRAVSEDFSIAKGGVAKTYRHPFDGDRNVHGKTKKRHRKPSRRSRSGSRRPSRKPSEKAEDSTHMMKRNEDEEIETNTGKEKFAAIIKNKTKTNFRRNRMLADKVETTNSKRSHSEKVNKSNSSAIRNKTEEPMESDSLMPTHMEAIVEEEGAGSRKSTAKKSCLIQ